MIKKIKYTYDVKGLDFDKVMNLIRDTVKHHKADDDVTEISCNAEELIIKMVMLE